MCTEFKRKTPASGGGYCFEGHGYQTRGVVAELQPVEVWHIVDDLKRAVQTEGGLDYFQVFRAMGDRREVWVIDDETHWTMLMPYEY